MIITAATLKSWNNENLFSVDYPVSDAKKHNAKNELDFLLNHFLRCRDNVPLVISDLKTLHIFFCTFNLVNTTAYSQVVNALEMILINHHGEQWLDIVKTKITHAVTLSQAIIAFDNAMPILKKYQDKVNLEQNFRTLCQHVDAIECSVNYFDRLAGSHIVSQFNFHQEAMDVAIQLSIIESLPYWRIYFDEIINMFWTEEEQPGFYPVKLKEYAATSGFTAGFLYSAFVMQKFYGLKDHDELFEKIISSSDRRAHGIAIIAALDMITRYESTFLPENFLNTKLIVEYPEHAVRLFRIFKRWRMLCPTIALPLNIIMNQDVLSNLHIVEHYFFEDEQINQYTRTFGLTDPIIKNWSERIKMVFNTLITARKEYHSLSIIKHHKNGPFAFLPEEILSKITSSLLPHTTSKVELPIIRFSPWRNRLSFPLSDEMINQLDSESLNDLKIAISKINFNECKSIFNQLSPQGLKLLLDTLEISYVIAHLFNSSYKIVDVAIQMPFECQKVFFSWFGRDCLLTYFSNPEKDGWRALHIVSRKNLFPFLLELLGSDEYIYNIITATTHSDLAEVTGSENWNIEECYYLLCRVCKVNTELFEKSLSRLGNDWLRSTNSTVSKLLDNLSLINPGDLLFDFILLNRIGASHLQTIFVKFGQIKNLFWLEKQNPVRIKILDMLGDEHLSNLEKSFNFAKNRSAATGLLQRILICEDTSKDNINQLFNQLHIDSHFLYELFSDLTALLAFFEDIKDREKKYKIDVIVQRMMPHLVSWLNDTPTLIRLLNYLPNDYYPAFLNHPDVINILPPLDKIYYLFYYWRHHEDKLSFYKALPSQLYEDHVVNLTAFEKTLSTFYQNTYIGIVQVLDIFIEKLSVITLSHIFQNYSSFLEYGFSNEGFSCLLKKLGAEYIKNMIPDYSTRDKLLNALPNEQALTLSSLLTISQEPEKRTYSPGLFKPADDGSFNVPAPVEDNKIGFNMSIV